jgi:uncharacterized protein YdbL (DUF1318 family)
MAADQALIRGARELAKSKDPVGAGAAAFTKAGGFEKISKAILSKDKERKDKIKQDNEEYKKYYQNRTTMQVSAVTDPRYQGIVGEWLSNEKMSYNDGANAAVANSEDVRSESYQSGVEQMNASNQHVQMLATQVQKFDKLKNEFGELIADGGMSFGTTEQERAIAKAIFGETSSATMSIDKEGKIQFTVPGQKDPIKLDDYKMPEAPDTSARNFIDLGSADISEGKLGVTEKSKKARKNQYEDLLKNEGSVKSLLNDFPEFEDMFKDVKARLDKGDIDFEQARDEMIDLIVEGEVTETAEYNRKANQTKDFEYGSQLKQLEELGKGEASNASVSVGAFTITWIGKEKGGYRVLKSGKKVGLYEDYDQLYNSVSELQKRVKTS